MKILTLNTEAKGGGASQIAQTLMRFYESTGHDSKMLNAVHASDDRKILPIDNDAYRNSVYRLTKKLLQASLDKGVPILPRLLGVLLALCEPVRTLQRASGREDFHQPATRRMPDLLQPRPQVIHAHNLFGEYFDLRQLPRISKQVPFILTLHDMWSFTGHCSHPLGCNRWLQACGKCPRLDLPPALTRDGTAANLDLKRRVYSDSCLHVATPSQWLMEQADQSVLHPGISTAKVIPNGIDQNAFRSGNKAAARQHLDLPSDAKILLFVAAGTRGNPWKDYETLDTATRIIAERLKDERLILLAPSASEARQEADDFEIQPIPWLEDKHALARYYQAADLYLHAAHAENFPNVILEALSCGLPVIGTRTGGIPEQIQEGLNGHIVPQADPEAMADKAHDLLTRPDQLARFSNNAARAAQGTYSIKRMGQEYLDWFEELLQAA